MSDWIQLRAFVEQWVDGKITDEPDPETRALFTLNRDAIVDLVQAEMERDAARQTARARDALMYTGGHGVTRNERAPRTAALVVLSYVLT